MEKGIIKMVIKVMIIFSILLLGSICLGIHYGVLMIESVSTSDQTNQDNGTGISDSSSSTNQTKK